MAMVVIYVKKNFITIIDAAKCFLHTSSIFFSSLNGNSRIFCMLLCLCAQLQQFPIPHPHPNTWLVWSDVSSITLIFSFSSSLMSDCSKLLYTPIPATGYLKLFLYLFILNKVLLERLIREIWVVFICVCVCIYEIKICAVISAIRWN